MPAEEVRTRRPTSQGDISADSAVPRPARWQFSLRTLAIAVTVSCVFLAILSWLGADAFEFALSLVFLVVQGALPVAIAVAAFYSRGAAQAFFLGASVMWVAVNVAPSPFGSRLSIVVQVPGLLAAGWLGAAVRRTVMRRGWDRP